MIVAADIERLWNKLGEDIAALNETRRLLGHFNHDPALTNEQANAVEDADEQIEIAMEKLDKASVIIRDMPDVR